MSGHRLEAVTRLWSDITIINQQCRPAPFMKAACDIPGDRPSRRTDFHHCLSRGVHQCRVNQQRRIR